MGQGYLLRRHAFACPVGEQVFLLDLRQDQYLALDNESSNLLSERIVGWPSVPQGSASARQPIDTTIEDLVRRELITLDADRGKSAQPVTNPEPAQTLMPPPEFGGPARPGLRLRHVRGIAASVLSVAAAAWRLRMSGIERIVTTLSRADQERDLNEDRARELVTVFYRVRPFLFTARDACLLDSLALLLLLRRFAIPSRWVFGVRTGPFSAHCWLQHRNMVINDTVERVRPYTPIMVV